MFGKINRFNELQPRMGNSRGIYYFELDDSYKLYANKAK